MLKIVGAVLILSGAGGFGIAKALSFYKQIRQLRAISDALELLKCELNYTLLPLPKLCEMTAKRTSGAAADFLRRYAAKLDGGRPRGRAAAEAMEEAKLCLPNDAKMALLELFGVLGRFDLDGENRVLQLTQHRLKAALERTEREKKPLAKGYAALGLCTGAALVILMV